MQSKEALPRHLAGEVAAGLLPGEAIAQIEVGRGGNFVYLVVDWAIRRAVLVDATSGVPSDLLAGQGLALEAVLLTHTHSDHADGLEGILAAHPAAAAYAHPLDRHRLGRCLSASARLRPLADGQVIRFGAARIEVLHTPGHTEGSCCFLVDGPPRCLLSGDTLFVRDCGRTDLPGGDVAAMFASLARIGRLPPQTLILPGHHYARECASTLERELRESPPLLARSVADLERLP